MPSSTRLLLPRQSSRAQLPVNSGLALDVLEGDPATQGAVDALVELANDSLDIIAWSLSELLERLAKVRRVLSIRTRPPLTHSAK